MRVFVVAILTIAACSGCLEPNDCHFRPEPSFAKPGCAKQAVCGDLAYWWQCICPPGEYYCMCGIEREIEPPATSRARLWHVESGDPCAKRDLADMYRKSIDAAIASTLSDPDLRHMLGL